MSQHDFNIANQGFPAFRSDLNDALVALGTNSSGATAPATTFAHQFWMDTAADPSILKVRNADNDAWITLGTFNQTTDTFTPAGVTSDKIEEGNSKVEVVDTGTGYIVFEVDGAEVARFNPDQLVTKAGTASTPAISPTGDLNTGIFFPTADTIAFSEGGTECARFNSSGNLQTIGTISVGNATPSTSGAGITFPATASASSDANTLDDYEEGTWTPTISFGSGSATVANAVCQYTKIGRMVHVSGRFTLTSVVSPSGNCTIGSLPFNANNPSGDGNRVGIQIYFENATTRIGDDIVGLLFDGGSSIDVRRSGTTGAGADLGGSVQSSTVFLIGGFYAST